VVPDLADVAPFPLSFRQERSPSHPLGPLRCSKRSFWRCCTANITSRESQLRFERWMSSCKAAWPRMLGIAMARQRSWRGIWGSGSRSSPLRRLRRPQRVDAARLANHLRVEPKAIERNSTSPPSRRRDGAHLTRVNVTGCSTPSMVSSITSPTCRPVASTLWPSIGPVVSANASPTTFP
jgi:hypothetical protein